MKKPHTSTLEPSRTSFRIDLTKPEEIFQELDVIIGSVKMIGEFAGLLVGDLEKWCLKS